MQLFFTHRLLLKEKTVENQITEEEKGLKEEQVQEKISTIPHKTKLKLNKLKPQ